jgi:alkaline phosphatase D
MSRRLFLQQLARLSSLAALAAYPHSAWAGGAGGGAGTPKIGYPFLLGVASGSPLPNGVVLWTRLIDSVKPDPLRAPPLPAVPFAVQWQVAHDEAFKQIVAQGQAQALPELAHSVHVDVTGLLPGTWYFYRFMHGDAISPVGRTRTAPALDAINPGLKLAVASCQHWEFGAYGAHRQIAHLNPDLVAFVGDYIYEWGPYHLQHPVEVTRSDESTTLAEYRARYAQYKTDPDLQASHLAAPWIVTWDDHEVSNDYANDRDYALDPHFLQRRAAAYQAFYEHMPIRLPTLPAGADRFAFLRIYQAYDWGQLARFLVLDDRQYRSYEVCPKPGQGGSNSVTKDCRERLNPKRTMLGAEQEAWLSRTLKQSNAQWNIITQQTIMAQNSQIPVKQPGNGRYWTDGWDGYPLARQALLNQLQQSRARNPLVLGGDVHTFYVSDLRPDFDRPVSKNNPVLATEFCGGSVTSTSRPQTRTEQYLRDNPHTMYGRSDKRGFMWLEINQQRAEMRCMTLEDVSRADSTIEALAKFGVQAGRHGVERLG